MIRQTRQNGLSHPRLNQTVFAGDLTMQNRDETLIWAWSLSSPIISRASHLRGIPIRREVENEKLTKFEKNWIRGATKHKTRAKGSLRDVGDRLEQDYGRRLRPTRPVTMMCLANRVCIWNAATCLQQPIRLGSETCVDIFQTVNRWKTPWSEFYLHGL